MISPGHSVPSLVDGLQGMAVDVHSVAVHPREYFREAATISRLCGDLRPDIVHTHGYRSDVVAGSVAHRLGIATVTTVHGFVRNGGKSRLYEWLQIRAFRQFDAVVAVSRPLFTELTGRGVARHRLRLVPNSRTGKVSYVDRHPARIRMGIPEGAFHIGWVGRLSREKGADILIEAMTCLRDLPILLSIVGEGREEAGLRRQAASAGLDERVRWHGPILEAQLIFPAFDALVLSSRTEGTPLVLLEAMDAELPIVATRVGGVPDLLTDAEALLVRPESPDELADAIRRLYADRVSAQARAKAARERLERRFDYERWLGAYDDIYRQVAANPSCMVER